MNQWNREFKWYKFQISTSYYVSGGAFFATTVHSFIQGRTFWNYSCFSLRWLKLTGNWEFLIIFTSSFLGLLWEWLQFLVSLIHLQSSIYLFTVCLFGCLCLLFFCGLWNHPFFWVCVRVCFSLSFFFCSMHYAIELLVFGRPIHLSRYLGLILKDLHIF